MSAEAGTTHGSTATWPTQPNPKSPALEFLIADYGTPWFPFWEWIAVALLVATVCAVFAQAPTPRTFRPPLSRAPNPVVRVVGAARLVKTGGRA